MSFPVDLPAGGRIQLHSSDEVDLFDRSKKKYVEDYHLGKTNDLVLLGAILQNQIVLYRAQRKINGEEIVFDAQGVSTGQYKVVPVEGDSMYGAMRLITQASEQIMKLEKALGIDKVAREAGGAHNIADYITMLKKAAHARGLHISKRTLAYEAFVGEARWRVRIWKNADAEDKQYHGLTSDAILEWQFDEFAKLEEIDKKFAREKGRVFIGKL